jgi:hypothetical protein
MGNHSAKTAWYQFFGAVGLAILILLCTYLRSASVLVWLKVISYGIIPMGLAWFGAHYAAEAIQAGRAKTMARVTFLVSGVLCVLMIAYIEFKSDTEHQTEVSGLEGQMIDLRQQETAILKHLSATPDEATRREDILTLLRHEWILSHKNVSPGLLSGTEQPPAAWVNGRLKQLGEKWTIQPSRAVQIPSPTTTSPSFGNLKKRTLDLADMIDAFVKRRLDAQKMYYHHQPLTEEEDLTWEKSNDVEFQQYYWDQLKSIHDDLARLNFEDTSLNEIIKSYDDRLRQRRFEAEEFWWGTYMRLDELQSISQRLRFLASQLP